MDAPEYTTKRCSYCRQEYPLTHEYYTRDKSRRSGFCSRCRNCLHKPKRMDTKWCPLCEKTLPRSIEYFGRNSRYGTAPYCIECERKRGRDKKAAIRRNPIHRDKVNERDRNREYKRYHSDEKVRAAKKKKSLIRRTRKKGLPAEFTSAEWYLCLSYFNHSCAVCGRPRGLWHTLAQDHWISLTDPRPDNPGTVAWNIVPLCHGDGGCNNSKFNKDAEQWLASKFPKRKAAEILKRINQYFEWIKSQ